jgi:hypothetical protein
VVQPRNSSKAEFQFRFFTWPAGDGVKLVIEISLGLTAKSPGFNLPTPHHHSNAASSTSCTKAPTPGSLDARDPATFKTRILCCSMNDRNF